MRKKRRNLLLAMLVFVALLCGLGWLLFSTHEPPEPVYQGKRLSEWLEEGFNAKTGDAVRQIGTNAFPALLWMLRAHDSKFELQFIQLAQKQHLIKIPFVEAWQRNRDAALGFKLLGAAASNAVPDLVQIYEKPFSEYSQICAASSLGAIGPAATAAVPVLLRTVANTNASSYLRGRVAIELGNILAKPEIVVPVLIECIKDPDSDVRESAVIGLGLFGSDAKVAVPAMIDALKDPDRYVGEQAERALKAIDPEAAARAGVK